MVRTLSKGSYEEKELFNMQATAAIDPNFQIRVPEKTSPGRIFVFFAADLIDPLVKSNNPDWLPGGILRPNVITLRHRHGYIRKCEITEMRQAMISESAVNIAPPERRHMVTEYDVQTGDTIRHIGRRQDGSHDGLLRTPWYPDFEVDRLTGVGDGIVRMPIATPDEAAEAQMFLFPYWQDILDGKTEIPRKIAALREYFRTRLAQAKTDLQNKVALAAIKSCDDFTAWGQRTAAEANQLLATAKAKGWVWTYGPDAELAFEQLGLQRQDSLVQDQGNQLNALTEAMTRFVKVQAPPPDPNEAEFEEFRRWKAAQEAARLIRPVDPPPLREWMKVKGRDAEIINANLFGKVRVRYDDGTEETVTREEAGLEKPEEPA